MQDPKLKTRKILTVPVSYRRSNRAHDAAIEAPPSGVRPMAQNSFEKNRTQDSDSPTWYCLRSQRNLECRAAVRLKTLAKVRVFCPQIRIQSPGNDFQRSSLITEPLFPGYFFAQFSLAEVLPALERVSDIRGIVVFDERPAVIEECLIQALRAETATVIKGLAPGDRFRLTDRGIHGAEAVITGLLSGGQRVQALLNFLASGANAEAPRENRSMMPSEPMLLRFTTRFTVIASDRASKPCAFERSSLAEQKPSTHIPDIVGWPSVLSTSLGISRIAVATDPWPRIQEAADPSSP